MPALLARALAVAALLGVAAPSFAEADLTRLVPTSAGLCLVVNDAAAHADQFRSGPLRSRWQEFPPLANWTAEHGPKLRKISEEISRQLGVNVDDLWRRAFGRRLVLAAWPPREPGKKDGPGLLLVQADEPSLLTALVSGIRNAQQRAGELIQSRDVRYGGLSYEERLIRRGESKVPIYLAVFGRVGVLTNDEQLMQQVLDLQGNPQQAGLSSTPAFQAAVREIDAGAPAILFINPRAWDAALASSWTSDKPPGHGRQLFLNTWQSLRYAVLTLSLHPQARLDGYIAIEQNEKDRGLSELLGSFSKGSELLERVPADCLAAAATNVDIASVLRWRQSHPDDEATPGSTEPSPHRRSLPEIIWSLIDSSFQGIGPGFCSFLAIPQQESSFPIAAVAAMQVGSRAEHMNATLSGPEALRSVLEAVTALAAQSGQPPPQLVTRTAGDAEILSLSGLPNVPADLQPAFGFTDRAMFAGTSPATVESVATLPAEQSLGTSPTFKNLLGPRMASPQHLVYANVKALRRWLAASEEPLVALLSKDGKREQEVRRGLKQLATLLTLADRAVAAIKVDEAGIRLCLVIAADPS